MMRLLLPTLFTFFAFSGFTQSLFNNAVVHKVEIEFHDFKKLGVTAAQLKKWIALVGWEALVHKKGTTWRMLDAETQSNITSEKKAIALMIEKTSVITQKSRLLKGKAEFPESFSTKATIGHLATSENLEM